MAAKQQRQRDDTTDRSSVDNEKVAAMGGEVCHNR